MYTKENVIGLTFYTGKNRQPYKGESLYTITAIEDSYFRLHYFYFEDKRKGDSMTYSIASILKQLDAGHWSIYNPQYEIY